MRIFYCGDAVVTAWDNTGHECMFRAGRLNAISEDQSGIRFTYGVTLSNTTLFSLSRGCQIDRLYSAFGFSHMSGSSWGFNGDRKDEVSGGYLLGNGRRTYLPKLMRFSNPDSLSPFLEGGLNAYAFARNDPVNFNDPTGQFPEFLGNLLTKMMPKKTYRGTIRWQQDGIVAFTGAQRKDGALETLYVHGHGKQGVITGNERDYTASDLFTQLRLHGIEMKGRQTHIFSCHSATRNSEGLSFADDMARLTKAQSSGYVGLVTAVGKSKPDNSYTLHRFNDMIIFRLASHTSTKIRRGELRKARPGKSVTLHKATIERQEP